MQINERAEAIRAAHRRLKLQSSVSLEEIKQAYRDMARISHPDLHSVEERDRWEAEMRELNAAYETIMDYCTRYAFSFDRAQVQEQCRRQDPFEFWMHLYAV